MGRKPLPSDVRDEVLEYAGAVPPAAIADAVGIAESTVYRILKEAGVKPVQVDADGNVKKLEEGQVSEMIERYLNWEPMSKLTGEYGITVHRFYEILNEAGITPKARTERKEQVANLQLEDAVQRFEKGDPLWLIRQETEVSTTRLYDELHRRGIPLRRRKT